MRKIASVFVAVCLVVAVKMSWAGENDVLAREYQALNKDVSAQAAQLTLTAAANTAAAQTAAGKDQCLAYRSAGAEGMPDFINFKCLSGENYPFLRRFCFREACRESMADEMKQTMTARGYAPFAAFPKRSMWLFQKGETPQSEQRPYCLASRSAISRGSEPKALYRIDCNDGAVTELTTPEPNGGLAMISQHMAARNFELLSRFELRAGYSALLFRQK